MVEGPLRRPPSPRLRRTPPPHCFATGRKMFWAILAAMDKFSGLRGASGRWEDIHIQKIIKILTETDRIMKEINLPLDRPLTFLPTAQRWGVGPSGGWWRDWSGWARVSGVGVILKGCSCRSCPSVVPLARHLPIAARRGGKCFGSFLPRGIKLAACGG